LRQVFWLALIFLFFLGAESVRSAEILWTWITGSAVFVFLVAVVNARQVVHEIRVDRTLGRVQFVYHWMAFRRFEEAKLNDVLSVRSDLLPGKFPVIAVSLKTKSREWVVAQFAPATIASRWKISIVGYQEPDVSERFRHSLAGVLDVQNAGYFGTKVVKAGSA
jgi:hypothetical protein